MGKVVMYASVSVDGFIADEHDQPGSLFDWLSSGDVPLDETGQLTVSRASYDHTRPYWDQIGVTIVGRHVFDLTDGWDGKRSARPRRRRTLPGAARDRRRRRARCSPAADELVGGRAIIRTPRDVVQDLGRRALD